jgi:hypothetical protein
MRLALPCTTHIPNRKNRRFWGYRNQLHPTQPDLKSTDPNRKRRSDLTPRDASRPTYPTIRQEPVSIVTVFTRINTTKLCEKTGLSRSYFFAGLRSGFFCEGIDTVLLPGNSRLWVLEVVLDRLANPTDEGARQRAIARYLESLPSNWPKSKQCKALAT